MGFQIVVGLVLHLAAFPLGALPDRDPAGRPSLRSESALIRWADTGEVLLAKNPDVVRPIASVTKLMSALVLSTASPALDELVTLSEDDKDRLKWSRSHLRVGMTFTWRALMQAALGASDNRAMYAAVRGTGVARQDFVDEMNRMAASMGMTHSHFADPAGIDPHNISTARDLLQLLEASAADEQVRSYTLASQIEMPSATSGRVLTLTNPDRLVRSESWQVVVGKTGYTSEAGRNLVVRAIVGGRPLDMVFLGSREMASVFGDAGRVRRWVETNVAQASLSPDTLEDTFEISGSKTSAGSPTAAAHVSLAAASPAESTTDSAASTGDATSDSTADSGPDADAADGAGAAAGDIDQPAADESEDGDDPGEDSPAAPAPSTPAP